MFAQWGIWDVEWVHEDGSSKRRPALVLSDSAYNEAHEEIWFVKISSQKHAAKGRIELMPGDSTFAVTGLRKRCFLYLTNVRQIPKSLVYEQRGVLHTSARLMVEWWIRTNLGWPY